MYVAVDSRPLMNAAGVGLIRQLDSAKQLQMATLPQAPQ